MESLNTFPMNYNVDKLGYHQIPCNIAFYFLPTVNKARNVPLTMALKNLSTVILLIVNTSWCPQVIDRQPRPNLDNNFLSILSKFGMNFQDFGTFFASLSIRPQLSSKRPHNICIVRDQDPNIT
jgi:hypothetical protein